MRKIGNEELGRPSQEEFSKMDKFPVVVVLDNLRSTNNIGSFFRTSDAFAIERVELCGICATPPNKEIHKTALGAENSVVWSYSQNTVDVIGRLNDEGYTIVAVEQVEGAVMLDEFEVKDGVKYALVFGNEVFGVSQEVVNMCDMSIEIPQLGTKHSLNVSVSAGITLWHFFSAYRGMKLKK